MLYLELMRRAKDLTQMDLSRATGIAATTLSMYERGMTPTEEHRNKLAQHLKCDPAKLTEPFNFRPEAKSQTQPPRYHLTPGLGLSGEQHAEIDREVAAKAGHMIAERNRKLKHSEKLKEIGKASAKDINTSIY